MQGLKPPKLPPKPTPSDPMPPETPESKCWDFIPIETTSVINELKAGDKIFGTFSGNRVSVNSEKGFVGYVPDSDATEMKNLAEETSKRLLGQVLSEESESRIIVQLCLL